MAVVVRRRVGFYLSLKKLKEWGACARGLRYLRRRLGTRERIWISARSLQDYIDLRGTRKYVRAADVSWLIASMDEELFKGGRPPSEIAVSYDDWPNPRVCTPRGLVASRSRR